MEHKKKHHCATSVLIVPLWNWNSSRWLLRLHILKVLIVPLWNWNKVLILLYLLAKAVLIVPLWNWNTCYLRKLVGRMRSNRTFMELKCKILRNVGRSGTVLIVPLWNWNSLKRFCQFSLIRVLIVPLWNWNWRSPSVMQSARSCSNRTFMELK